MPKTKETLEQRERTEQEAVRTMGVVLLRIFQEKNPLFLSSRDLAKAFIKRPEISIPWWQRMLRFVAADPLLYSVYVEEALEQLIKEGEVVEHEQVKGWYKLP